MIEAEHWSNRSAQAPPCSRNRRPSAASASCSRSRATSHEVTNGGSDTVSVVRDDADPANIGWVRTIDVGDVPQGVAVDVAKNMIYVGNAGDRSVSVIDGETHTVIKTIPLE